MKSLTLIILSLMTATTLNAQEKPSTVPESQPAGKQEVSGNYKFQISVDSQRDSIGILNLNRQLDQLSRRSGNRNLGSTIKIAFGSGVTQRTVNATSNLVSLGVNWIVSEMQKKSKNFESWSKAKQQQCTYTRDLSSEEKIEDFYYLPSTNGALDPRNIKFNGFTCRNYIAVDSVNGRKSGKEKALQAKKPEEKKEMGHDAFYISCSLRKDSLGIAHMANHSKFLLEVDSLIFYPRYCNIPNMNGRKADESFNFDQFSNIEFQVKVKISSSWINEAVMVTDNQQLGEFTIIAKISKSMLDNGAFVYNRKNEKTLDAVSISGDSFVVPRSFVGTVDTPIWGTGQYKLSLEISESSQLNASYYKIEGVGEGEAVSFANLPGYKRWDKKIWQTEWKAMNERKAGDSFLKSAWKAVKTAYVDDNWVKELVDPVATSIYQEETKELKKLFNLDEVSSTTVGFSSQVPAQK